jgi:hypothetical protein
MRGRGRGRGRGGGRGRGRGKGPRSEQDEGNYEDNATTVGQHEGGFVTILIVISLRTSQTHLPKPYLPHKIKPRSQE